MARPRAYLDHNASAPLRASAREAMLAAFDAGNPSSVHAEGRAARRVVEDARRAVASLVGGRAEDVVFTASATEAASTLLRPDWREGRARLGFSHLYVCEADHPCLRAGGHFTADQVTRIGVDGDGLLDFDALAECLTRHDRAQGLPLVACHLANNETGVIQDWARLVDLVQERGGRLVLDAVQAAGRIDLKNVGAHHLILSAHKLGGPKGAGAILSVCDGIAPAPLHVGGGQERGLRAGTENVVAIAGFGAAAREALGEVERMAAVAALRDRFAQTVRACAPGAVFHGEGASRLANTLFFSLPGLKAETAQIGFDLAGVALSAGSACSSGKVGPSHVLRAMGVDDEGGALRVSIGAQTGEAELALFEVALARVWGGVAKAAA